MRWPLLFALCAMAMPVTASAQASSPAARDPNRVAYDYAVRCFAAAPLARERGMASDNGIRAYDAAQTLGTRLGYSSQQTANDVKVRTNTELAAMLRDAAYLNRTLSDCQRLGLL